MPLTAAGFLFADDPVHVTYHPLAAETIQQRLELVQKKPLDRKAALESLFRDAGCTAGNLTTQPVKRHKEPNVICTLPGTVDSTIVVGGHYDLSDRGMGAVDDWSGVVLLPSLYESLREKPRRHRFVFAAFSAEETGLYGSREYVARLSKEDKAATHAMINLECLGLTPPKVWASRADPKLLEMYAHAVQSLGLADVGVNVDQVGDDDSHPFLNAGIPVLTIHSLDSQTLPILHSKRDQVNAIHQDYYFAAYKLAAVYLAYLDMAID